MTDDTTFTIEPKGTYSLEASASFARGFAPCASSIQCDDEGGLSLAFCLDGNFEPTFVKLREDAREKREEARMGRADRQLWEVSRPSCGREKREGRRILGSARGTRDARAVKNQVSRILSLDFDGLGYDAVGVRDPAIGRLQRQFHFMRPVCFPSPYEAAAWGILSARTTMRQAAAVKARLTGETGAFPAPARLLEMTSIQGLSAEKVERLHGVAEAALTGFLDADRLRALPRDEALAELETLRGVGPWTAAHIYLRGAAVRDEPAFMEPRVRRGFALAYGLDREPTDAELERASERWRPFRTWVSVLLAAFLSRSGEWDLPRSGARRPASRRPIDARERPTARTNIAR